MAEFPTTPVPFAPLEISANWKTIISGFDSGVEQRRQKQTYPKYDVALTYAALLDADFMTLWNFYQSMKGALKAFYFYTLESSDWDGLFVGTGDDATVIFDIPGKDTTATLIYINGIAVDSADYTLLTGGGLESADRVQFDTAPAANDIITCDFTGYMRIRCRFENDKMTRTEFAKAVYSTGLRLKGLAAL